MTSNNVFPSAVYQEVKAWIARQEEFEATHNKPAPLTPAQRRALETLRPVPLAALPDNLNFIGMLNEFSQTDSWMGKIHYTSGGSPEMWTCTVSMGQAFVHGSEVIKSFPAPKYGAGKDGQIPTFSSKKAAKSHAAQSAVNWLVASGKMDRSFALTYFGSNGTPAGGVQVHQQQPAVAAPAPQAAVVVEKEDKHKNRKGEDEDEEATVVGEESTGGAPLKRSLSARTAASNSPLPPTPKKLQKPVGTIDGTTDEHDDQTPLAPPTTESVTSLCRELNFPLPKVRFVDSKVGLGLLDAWPEFEHYGDEELIGLQESATVRGLQDRAALQRAVDARLLNRLRAIRTTREEQFESLEKMLGRDL